MVCRTFRQKYGDDLRVGRDLAAWATEEIAREGSQVALRAAVDADLGEVPTLAPALDKAMAARPFQRVGARFIADGRRVILADEPGVGKTLETLGGLVETGAQTVLVFAKKKAIEAVWAAEIPRWLGDLADVYPVLGTQGARDKIIDRFLRDLKEGDPDQMRVIICNIEMCRTIKVPHPCAECGDGDDYNCPRKSRHKMDYDYKYPQLFSTVWDAIIVDESHKALIGKNVMSKAITQARLGMMRLKVAEDGIKVAISGTPYRGKLENGWGTLNWLRPDIFTSYWTWVQTYFEVKENRYGGREIKGLDPAKTDAFDAMMAPYMLRRTKAEVAPDMPPKQYGGTPLDPTDPATTIGVWLEMEPAQKRRYQQIKDEGSLLFADGAEIFINGVLPELTRRKQFATCDWDAVERIDSHGETIIDLVPGKSSSSNKYQWLLEFIEERQAAGLKVVVASQFTKVVNAFSAWLMADGVPSYTLTGETSDKRSAASIAAFNDPTDSVPAMLLNIMAGGESINLDACCDDLVFLDETFIPDDQEQVENRIHRLSRNHQVNIWYVRSRGTIEEAICRTVGAREMITKGRLDGSRGIEAMRRLIEEDGHAAIERYRKAEAKGRTFLTRPQTLGKYRDGVSK
jgi:SNF2 family DNA or RNA helicase